MNVRCLIMAWFLALLACTELRAQDLLKIGEQAPKLKFIDIRCLPRTLDDFGAKKAFVLVFTNTTCPLAKRYLPTVQKLADEYKDVQFIAINPAEEDSIVAMATQAVQQGMEIPFVKDQLGACARALGVRRTPEAVILDKDYRLRYRGRIDDQYRLGGVRPEPTRRDLKDALDAVLAGRKVVNAETEVDGCPITFPEARKPKEVTFAEHVAPVLRKHCWDCHREGGQAPFSLTGFKDVSTRARAVAEAVTDERMPPWFASHDFGPFINRRGLADDERNVILDWVRSGKQSGDLTKAPSPAKQPEGKWMIDPPDLVLDGPLHELPASGDIGYKYVILPYIFAADTWVQAVQIRPDNPRVLHHCNMAYANISEGFKTSNFITGNVPGGETTALDDGVAIRIPKGSILALEAHYVATGKPEKCRISVGLRFPRVVVQKQLRCTQIVTTRFAIPPGAPAHKVASSRTLDRDAVGVALFSHMHVRGKDMTFTAHLPDGKDETLLVIPNYNFSWQVAYRWEAGKKQLPKGTRLECVAHYDNSEFNPYNPDPKATVRHGLQTHQEMMFGFFFYTDAAEHLGLNVDPKNGRERK